MPSLSVCMIVKNEEANISDALEGLKSFADEIVVVDTGSTDRTREIAARYTHNIYDFEWIDDFSAARNFAISKATGDYHLWLDADDRIAPAMSGKINELKSRFDGKKAFYFVLENHQNNAPASSCRQLRCTPLIPGVQFESRIHEQIFPSAIRAGLELVSTDIVVVHLGYMTQEARIAKAKRNLDILERQREEGGDSGALYFFLATTHSAVGDKQKAVRYMELALERSHQEYYNQHLIPEGYLFLARTDFELGNRDGALRYLTKARSLVDGSPQHNFHMGILYQRLDRHREAISCLRQALGKSSVTGLFPTHPLPGDSETMLHIAYSLFCCNERQHAMKTLNASVGPNFDLRRSWEWLGVKSFAFKNMDLAQFSFENALRLGGLEAESWRALGKLYEMRGFSHKAEECLKRSSG